MFNRFQAMVVFTRIVETNSFSRAAVSLNLPRASASNIIKSLEAHLRVRLLYRTTRRINLTAEGAQYYERCVQILSELEETEYSLTSGASGIHGTLRINLPPAIGRTVIVPRIHEFCSMYPQVDLRIGFSDRRVDLVQEGVDCAIRVGLLEDSSLIARQFGHMEMVTSASPRYVQRHGCPFEIDDLPRHFAVHLLSGSGRNLDFNFVRNGHAAQIRIPGTVAVTDVDAYIRCGLDGMGLIQVPAFMVREHLRSGELLELICHHRPRPIPVSAIYPANRHLSSKVRAFVEWAGSLFENYLKPQANAVHRRRASTSHLAVMPNSYSTDADTRTPVT
ncbi:LysR family transcriptional regulator [Paraburkholderia sp. BL10I2N1]|uniref:LysR family transcriptional regulator n=1 Tax=Paraburkholderia sp. BL10I2N1 TaxID=1938796 RepID=UPI001061AEAC|nr:LysR family transcriptional regulator [Paraburkholderia sp. BL10I2N1]